MLRESIFSPCSSTTNHEALPYLCVPEGSLRRTLFSLPAGELWLQGCLLLVPLRLSPVPALLTFRQINEDWLMLKGCVIGCKKRCITLRKSLMSHSRRIHLEVSIVSSIFSFFCSAPLLTFSILVRPSFEIGLYSLYVLHVRVSWPHEETYR